MIRELTIGPKTIKLLEENIRVNLLGPEIR